MVGNTVLREVIGPYLFRPAAGAYLGAALLGYLLFLFPLPSPGSSDLWGIWSRAQAPQVSDVFLYIVQMLPSPV